MRVAALDRLFATAVVSASLVRGSPCGNPCSEEPAGTTVYDIAAPDAGADAAADADAGAPPEPGTPSLDECRLLCHDTAPNSSNGPHVTACTVFLNDAGASDAGSRMQVACDETAFELCSGGGRRTEGVTDGAFEARSATGVFFAFSAAREASSVLSFRRLREEIRAHRAPRGLLRAMSRAARDEARHARAMGSLARRSGARLQSPHAIPARPRTLEALCVENAVEGCVVETYSALLARWQVTRARDPEVAGVMRRIARDETRHAALAWELARWAEQRLDAGARDRVDRARREAFRVLAERVRRSAVPELVAAGLVPVGDEAAHLVASLEAGLSV